MLKKESELKKRIARDMYVRGEAQKDIAEFVGVSPVTVSNWVKNNDWAVRKAAVSITRPELINKTLLLINSILDKVNEEADPIEAYGNVASKLANLATFIEKMDKKVNLVTVMEVCTNIEKWLRKRQSWDKDIPQDFLQLLNKYQDLYIEDFVAQNGDD